MKHTQYLTLAICGLLLGACSEKSANTTTPRTSNSATSAIQGTWETQRGSTKIQLLLNPDGTSAVNFNGKLIPTGTWKQQGSQIIITNPGIQESTAMTIVSQTGNQLVLKDAANASDVTYNRIN